jgi:hypothetical protein
MKNKQKAVIMKLTNKQKEKLIGKKIEIDHIMKPEYENSTFNWDGTKDKAKRKIVKFKCDCEEVLIIGFTHLCEGVAELIDYESGYSFINKKRIPVIKVASGMFGKILYTSYESIKGLI